MTDPDGVEAFAGTLMDGLPYVVSDERLAEIREMFTLEGETDLRVTPGVSREWLAWALHDLLAERDECEAAE